MNHIPPPSLPHKKPTSIFTTLSLLLVLSSPKIPHILSLPRRFLSPTTMSITTNKNPFFPTPQSLSEWLKPRLPSDSLSSWGVKSGTKNINNLWLELAEGETHITDSSPPVRNINVVIVRVIHKKTGLFLIEEQQLLSNGSVRTRSRPLSEKMKPGELVEPAVFRAVKEELGVFDGVEILEGSYVKKVEMRGSLSYPGLEACYVLHRVDAYVEGLPEGEFVTEEKEEYGETSEKRVAHGALFCVKHFWKWVEPHLVS